MSLTATRTDAKRLLPILDPDYSNLDPDQQSQLWDLAHAALRASYELFEEKAKFTVVGQVMWLNGKTVQPYDPEAEKVCLGVFATETSASNEAEKLFGSPGSKEVLRTWVLPVWHETPAAWRKARKEALEADEEASRGEGQAEAVGRMCSEGAALALKCERLAPNTEGEFVQCVRTVDHRGACFAEIPSMDGV